MVVHRYTLFQIPQPEDVGLVSEEYRKLGANATKDGKPYILSCEPQATLPDPRSQGYTLSALLTFESLDDMKFFDTQCPMHQALKEFAGPKKVGAPLAFYFER